MAILTVYRPPKCPTKYFKDTLEEINGWIDTLNAENKENPRIILNGDFNMPDMEMWSEIEICDLLESVNNRIDNGNTVSDTNI